MVTPSVLVTVTTGSFATTIAMVWSLEPAVQVWAMDPAGTVMPLGAWQLPLAELSSASVGTGAMLSPSPIA